MVFKRLLTRLSKKTTSAARKKENRRLLVEHLTARELMASDLGAISGIAFTDANGDGQLTAGEVRLEGVQVQLFRDSGAGNTGTLVTSGANADPLVQTDTTDDSTPAIAGQPVKVPGEFRFERLTAGDYWIVQAAVPGQTAPAARLVTVTDVDGQQTELIDDYSTTAVNATAIGATSVDVDSTAATEAIGESRDIRATRTNGSGNIIVEVDTVQNALTISSGGGGIGNALVQYDGADNSINLNPLGLNGAILSGQLPVDPLDPTGTQRAFPGAGIVLLTRAADAGEQLTITVHSGVGNSSSTVVDVPLNATNFTEQFVPFSDFDIVTGTGAQFDNVGAIEATANLSGDNDIRVSIVEAIRPVPVVSNLANIQPLSLGGEIFIDNSAFTNTAGVRTEQNDGIRQTAEPLVTPSITVDLYNVDPSAPGFNPTTATKVATTTTSGGIYAFDNLNPGDYYVVLAESNFASGGALFGFQTSNPSFPATDTAIDPDNDVDKDDNGVRVTGVGIVTAAVSLFSGTEPTTDGDDANKNSTVDFGVVPVIDLAITKTLVGAPPANVNAGGQAIFNIEVRNNGPLTATDVRVQDIIPNGLTFVRTQTAAGNPTGFTQNVNGANIEVVIGTIPASGLQTFQIVTTVGADGTITNITNTATVTGNEFENVTPNNSSSAPVIVDPDFNVVVSKSVDKTTVKPTETIVYTVTMTNEGPSPANDVVLTDLIPSDLTFVSATFNGAASSVTPTNGQLVFPAIDVLSGATNAITATLTFTVNALATGTITNTASVPDMTTDGERTASDNTGSVPITVTPDFDLVVNKIADQTSVQPNDTVIYTVTVTNEGPSTATGVVLTDVVPSGLTLVTAVLGSQQGVVSGSNIVFPAVTIPSGTANAVTATLTFTVNADAIGTINNVARVPDLTAQGENDNTNNEDDAPITVTPEFDVVVDKTVNVANPKPNDEVVYSVKLTNTGPSTANGVILTDAIPAGLTFVSGTLAGNTVTTATGNNIVFPAVNILSGDANAVTATLRFTVNPNATGTINNTASVQNMTANGETNAANNTDTIPINVGADFDIIVDKSINTPTAKPNGTVIYTVTLTNEGPSSASNVVLRDPVPTGLTFVSGTLDGVTGTLNNGVVEFAPITVNSGTANAKTATLTFTVNASASATITNTASVADMTANGERTASNNSDSVPLTVTPDFDVVVNKTVNNTAPAPGDTVEYTVTLTNEGPSSATGVILTDPVPAGLTFVSGTLGATAGTLVGNNVVFPAITVSSGASNAVTGTLRFTVSGTASGQITNVASTNDLTANGERLTTNNSDDAVITVTPVVDLTVTKSVDKTNSKAGDTLVYQVTVTNNGPSTAAAVQAVDTLPAGVTFVSGTGPNNTTLTAANGVITVAAPGGILASGGSFSFTINATVNQPATTGVPAALVNNVVVSTTTNEPNKVNNNASASTSVDPKRSRIDGFVFIDANNNSQFDANEAPVPNVQVQLTGTDVFGNPVSLTDTTDATGQYAFENLFAGGNYRVQRLDRPTGLRDGGEQAGTGANATINNVDNVFTALGLDAADSAEDFNFGLLNAALSKRNFLASS